MTFDRICELVSSGACVVFVGVDGAERGEYRVVTDHGAIPAIAVADLRSRGLLVPDEDSLYRYRSPQLAPNCDQ